MSSHTWDIIELCLLGFLVISSSVSVYLNWCFLKDLKKHEDAVKKFLNIK